MAVAYIMSITDLSWKEALKVVRVGRSIANPNVGFQQQLKDFESSRLSEVRFEEMKLPPPLPPRSFQSRNWKCQNCALHLSVFPYFPLGSPPNARFRARVPSCSVCSFN